MSEIGIVMRAHTGDRNVGSAVRTCATCKRNRHTSRFDRCAFCRDCLDRSRIDDDDDLGGEG